MAIDDEEQRKAVSGIVTPDASKGEDWRRQVSGVYSFGDDEDSGGSASSGGSPMFSALLPVSFSPSYPPVAIAGG